MDMLDAFIFSKMQANPDWLARPGMRSPHEQAFFSFPLSTLTSLFPIQPENLFSAMRSPTFSLRMPASPILSHPIPAMRLRTPLAPPIAQLFPCSFAFLI